MSFDEDLINRIGLFKPGSLGVWKIEYSSNGRTLKFNYLRDESDGEWFVSSDCGFELLTKHFVDDVLNRGTFKPVDDIAVNLYNEIANGDYARILIMKKLDDDLGRLYAEIDRLNESAENKQDQYSEFHKSVEDESLLDWLITRGSK